MVVGESFVVDAEQVHDGRVQVVPIEWVLDGPHADFVGGSVGESVLKAGSGEPDREAILIVVPALADLVRRRLRERGSTELAGEEEQGVVEQSALAEVA